MLYFISNMLKYSLLRSVLGCDTITQNFYYMNKIIGFLVLGLFTNIVWSQNLDSLLLNAKQNPNDSIKIRLYNKVAFSYIFNEPSKAIEIIREGKALANTAKFNFGLTELINTQGIYMDVTGQSDSAKYYFEKALQLSRQHKFQNIESMCVNNLGMFNWNRGNYDTALDYFFQSYRIDESRNNEKSTGAALNNIGLIYQEMNLSEKALEYHKKALAVREKYKLENDQIASLNNIGINLKDLGRTKEAIVYFKQGIVLAKKTNNLIDYYRLLDNLANAYYMQNNHELALKTYLKALDRASHFKADEKSLLSIYNNIASLYNEKNKPKLALNYIEKGFALTDTYPDIKLVAADLYLTSAESHYMLDDFEKARHLKSEYIVLKDSIFSEVNAEKIADLEIKYETEKKETEILLQRAKIAERDLLIQKRNYQLWSLIGFAVLLSIVGGLFYNQQKIKNAQLQKENELKDALLKIETQNKLQEQRLRISRDLHDNIGAQLTFIISSIDNLKFVFDIKNPNLNNKLTAISDFASDTIYELRDTIWALNKTEISLDDLQVRISNFIDKANLASQNILFNFTVNELVDTNHVFTSTDGMNIYRITQEAINNALKYAKANRITVSISQKESRFIIKIIDDGIGFMVSEVTLGNGLRNMKKRAQDIGGDIKIASELQKGTEVTLYL